MSKTNKRKKPKQEDIYRWSPKPIEETIPVGLNLWIDRSDTALWNIVWLMLPEVETEEVSQERREALLKVFHEGIEEGLTNHTPVMAKSSAGYVARVLAGSKWDDPPAALDPAKYGDSWRERAEQARSDSPRDLIANTVIPVHDVTQARQTLRKLKLATRFMDRDPPKPRKKRNLSK